MTVSRAARVPREDGPVSTANSPGSTAHSPAYVYEARVRASTGKVTSVLPPGASSTRTKPRSSRTRGHEVPPSTRRTYSWTVSRTGLPPVLVTRTVQLSGCVPSPKRPTATDGRDSRGAPYSTVVYDRPWPNGWTGVAGWST